LIELQALLAQRVSEASARAHLRAAARFIGVSPD